MAIIKGKITKGNAPSVNWIDKKGVKKTYAPKSFSAMSPDEAEGIAVRRAKWESLKEEFLELSITGRDVHWPTLAAKYGFKAGTCRHKASTQKWYAEISERRQRREEILEAKLTERTSMALEKLNEDFATNEAAIRKRHAVMARGLQARAITRIKEIEMKDLTARDALYMLKLGIDEERYAMGLPQIYTGPKETGAPSEFAPIAEQLGGHHKVQELGMMLLKAITNTNLDAEYAQDAGLTDPGVITDVPDPAYEPVLELEDEAEDVEDEEIDGSV